MKKRILVLATGGTIAGVSHSSVDTTSYQAAVLPISYILEKMPELQHVANVTGEQLANLDSSNMMPAIWLALAEKINLVLASSEVDGVVVTHGTDTLEETAYFLNLTIKSRKPVVMVGAMRPATAMSTDGPMNLYDAVALAASDEAVDKGVLVTLNNTIHSSRDVTKTNTFLQDSFKATELGCLGYIIDGYPKFYRLAGRKHTMASEFDVRGLNMLPQVEIIYSYAGASQALIDSAVGIGARGIVYAGLGNGGIPDYCQSALVTARKNGVIIVRSSRVDNGVVIRNGFLNDDEFDFIVADNLNPQKARILLMLALTRTQDSAAIQRMFEEY